MWGARHTPLSSSSVSTPSPSLSTSEKSFADSAEAALNINSNLREETNAWRATCRTPVHGYCRRVPSWRARRREWDACALSLIDHPIPVGVRCPVVVREGHLVGRIAQPRAGSLRGRVGRAVLLEEARPRPRHCCLVRRVRTVCAATHTPRRALVVRYDGPVTTRARRQTRETCELS